MSLSRGAPPGYNTALHRRSRTPFLGGKEGTVSVDPNAKANMQALRDNPYPGRGIVIGQTPDARHYVQVYWIMGRSENSRNRVFVCEGDTVRTAPYDPSRAKDPSLIIYNCARVVDRCHIVSNGNQTDTVFGALRAEGTFEEALFECRAEPDVPNYTARIAGLVDLDDRHHVYKLSIVKLHRHDPDHCVRQVFCYEAGMPGLGHCIHTYAGDGNPLPYFEGEPYVVALPNDLDKTAELFWGILNAENKISVMAKFIDAESGQSEVRIINKHGGT